MLVINGWVRKLSLTSVTNMIVTIMIVTISTFNQLFFRFYMVLLLEVQIKMINILMIEMITLQMKLLAITMLVGKELWQLLFNKICNFTNKIYSFYSKTITFSELSRCSRNCTSKLLSLYVIAYYVRHQENYEIKPKM